MVPFEFADGSAFYENEGLYAHADALRETGNPEVAAVLRAERLVASDLEEGNELIIGLGLVDDFVRLDEMDRAYDQLMSLQAMWPRSPSLHGHMADFYLDLGDLESAEFHIWYVTDVLGLRMGMRGMFAQYRIHLHNEDLIAAQEVINEAMSLRKQSHRLRARQAEIYRLQGDPSNAVSTLQQRRYWFQEHPEMKAVEALALYESGRLEEAATVAERILKVYPGHPAMAELEPVMVASED
jgi:tetratricopeptide (TPR) repeat protein